ncbi:uncharacterized protein LOC124163981 [Ischnura elegans]|uniref:uncharacterized protein LOC124163981 n=1 Tax=Ischnura elegans TaxID=197161 RepID=UPI001ED8AA3F|nr:uncharacterized protein LOC124163981 [Ischnura elegans]
MQLFIPQAIRIGKVDFVPDTPTSQYVLRWPRVHLPSSEAASVWTSHRRFYNTGGSSSERLVMKSKSSTHCTRIPLSRRFSQYGTAVLDIISDLYPILLLTAGEYTDTFFLQILLEWCFAKELVILLRF